MLGFISCAYLLSTLGYVNWLRFFIWMLIGVVIYFFYGIKHSKLNGR
ncbi:MAG TPA: amino acid permease C-terminal domain-containing protein [Chitinophagales bacterium]|nr:amino acid permease C-terminal domain-containing protein [Chitinophagales bacterium]